MKPNFFNIVDNVLYFKGVYMEMYIPDYLFTKKLSQYNGNLIETIGLINFRVFNNLNDDRSKVRLQTLKHPTMMTTKPNSIEVKEMSLVKNSKPEKYHILKYYDGDVVMTSTLSVASIDNVEVFVNLLTAGKIPQTIPYNTLLHLFMKNLELNKVNLNVPATTLSIIISEMCRDKKNQANPFRKVAGKDPKADQLGYINSSIRQVCASNSTFSALTFEDVDTMITASINRKRHNRKNNYSPIEKIIMV